MADSPILHAKKVISLVAKQHDRAILFYSGGKDSLVLLDLMAPSFKEVVCVFMYFVKGLRHIQPFLDHVKQYPNTRLVQVPHFMLTSIFNVGRYCPPDPRIKVKNLKDVDAHIRRQTGFGCSFYGWKQADGMTRRIVLRQYREQAICDATSKVYPLTLWKKADIMAYIAQTRLPKPVDYGSKRASVGVEFDPDAFAWLRQYYPDDLEKIYKVFPASREILFKYDQDERKDEISGIRSEGNSPDADKKRALQSPENKGKCSKGAKEKPKRARIDDDAGVE